jgi:NUDIX domain
MEQSGARRTHGARRRVSAAGRGTQSNNATVACALTRTFFCRSKIRWLAAPSAQHYGEKIFHYFQKTRSELHPRLRALFSLGKRRNAHATDAFARLAKTETDQAVSFDAAGLIGVFEHFYDNNRSGNGGYGTHYVVLRYELRWPGTVEPRPDDQHSELRWWPVADLIASDRVHENAKTYFRPSGRQSHARL